MSKTHFTSTNDDWIYVLGILFFFVVLTIGSPPIFLEKVPNNKSVRDINMEKIVKARKNYKCDYCALPIKKREKYILGKGKGPTYDKEDNQTGIKYYQYRICLCHNEGEKKIEESEMNLLLSETSRGKE